MTLMFGSRNVIALSVKNGAALQFMYLLWYSIFNELVMEYLQLFIIDYANDRQLLAKGLSLTNYILPYISCKHKVKFLPLNVENANFFTIDLFMLDRCVIIECFVKSDII